MQKFLQFFGDIGTIDKLIWIFVCLIFFWILEAIIPMFRHDYNKLRHDGVNMIFMLMIMVLNVIIGLAFVGVFYWVNQNQFGLISWIDVPVWAELVISLVTLDFVSQYTAHYALHKFKWMWKLHMVHHSDTKVDATTGLRQHPVEYVLRESFALATILVVGMPVAYYLFYRMVTIFFTYWTHANITLPIWLDKLLSWIIITPNAHKFHHHFERPWTDSNFGNVLSIWDRIFGTFVYDNPKEIKYGLDVLDDSLDEDIIYQLKIPIDNSIETDY